MKTRQTGCTQELSSAKAGISVRSGRRIEKGGTVKQKSRHWRTRKGPLEAVWDTPLVPLVGTGAFFNGHHFVGLSR